MTRLRVLTLNTGLLELSVLGRSVLAVPHRAARLAALGPALARGDADVLCLQEVFRRADRDELVAAVRDAYPHVVRHDDRRRGLTHGLLLLSRHPVTDTAFVRFAAQDRWQQLVVRQGVLAATVHVPGAGALRVLDTHTAAGGARGPERPSVERLRARQLAEVHAAVEASALPALVCGDLNAGPEASAANYRELLARGYADAFVAAGGVGVTWDPHNALSAGGVFAGSPSQRVDHVLLDRRAAQAWTATAARVVHDEPVVDVAGQRVTLSDHAGVQVELTAAAD